MNEETTSRPRLDLGLLRERLAAGAPGRDYWRSLDELAGTDEFRDLLARELPAGALDFEDGFSRRRFFHLMGASLALGGLTACTRQPPERIVPYVEAPEDLVPGRPLEYATSLVFGGYGVGVLAESHMGRPTKLEGNPLHPASLGGTDAWTQAAVLSLYDPDRSRNVLHLGKIRTWKAFFDDVRPALEAQKAIAGAGLRLLTETVTSPTLQGQLDAILELFPAAKWHRWEPTMRDEARAGVARAFAEPIDVRPDLSKADVVVALEADLLAGGPGSVRHAKEFGRRRKVRDERIVPNRLYAVESTPTPTGSIADHRLALAPSEIGAFAVALGAALGVPGVPEPSGFREGALGRFVAAVAADLRGHRGRAVVVAGDALPAAVHALVAAINDAVEALRGPLVATASIESRPVARLASLRELVDDMRAGSVDLLLVLAANPAFTAPADLDFARALEKVPLRVHHGLHFDETAERCHWHLPATHELEGWSDVRAFDGTESIVQPTIEQLFDGKSAHELLAVILGAEKPGHEIVRAAWEERYPGADAERRWRKALHDGLVAGTESPRREDVAVHDGVAAEAAAAIERARGPAERIDVALRPDPTIGDGRFANNGWLQELPKPITKLTWDNAALVSPALAARHGLANEDVVEIEADGRAVTLPVWIVPGQADNTVTLHYGYGRRRAGRVGTGAGTDVYPLRTSGSPWLVAGVKLRATGRTSRLATTQSHHDMEGRHLVRHASLEEYRTNPGFVRELDHVDPKLSMHPDWKCEGYAWGLAIDLSSCIGCNACTIACQSENNIPIVGKDQVARGREMHWLRIDRYFEGELDAPAVHHQPVLCMHCEQAPCEIVCPVGATVHSDEGLNDMVYNRCVGTRYCSNNCPYKVRRFNFFKYNDTEDPVLALGRNPDVTVRVRGVMEKCTYCVQRINLARIDSKREGRKVKDGEITTACQQACPTEAIVFGDVNDPASEVSRWKASPLDYGLLAELGTRPRTTYLAKVRNPNPELEGA